MPRKVRQPHLPINLRRLGMFEEISCGRPKTKKLHPERSAKARPATSELTQLVNGLVRDGRSLIEISKTLKVNRTTVRFRYYGLADMSPATDIPGFYRMHLGASCALDYSVDYDNLPERPTAVYKNRHKLGRKKKKKGPTLRELLYNK